MLHVFVAAFLPAHEYISQFESILDERSDHILPLFYEDMKKVCLLYLEGII